MCNGAGPRGWGWAVPDRLFGLSISRAADVHDWDYAHARNDDQRHAADFRFLCNMVRIILARDHIASWVERRLTLPRLMWAMRYHYAVHCFGGRFSAGEEAQIPPDLREGHR